MKKIINGRRYDTESARELAAASSGLSYSDFSHWEETLYVKKTGEYFLHGIGGPMSRYAEPSGQNGWSGGERIMPMSLEEAKAWAEEHLSGDEYEDIFGTVEETDERRTVTYSLPLATIDTVKRKAISKNLSMSDYIADLVDEDKTTKRLQLTVEYTKGLVLKRLIHWARLEDGKLVYIVDQQVHGIAPEQIRIPIENIKSFSIDPVLCEGWTVIGEEQ